MFFYIIISVIFLWLIFFIATYPYQKRFIHKMMRVRTYEEVSEIKNQDIDYDRYDRSLVKKEVLKIYSNLVAENIEYVILSEKKYIGEKLPCIIFFHGLRDCNDDWLDNAKIIENYLYVREKFNVAPFNIVLVNSGYDGKSWYSNFANKSIYKYEDLVIKELYPKLKKDLNVSSFGVAGFSMGGHAAFKFGLRYTDLFKVVGSFSGAVSIVRMAINRRALMLFRFLYIPKFIFSNEDNKDFIDVFGHFGYKILKEDPYSIIKKTSYDLIKNQYYYLSVGNQDSDNHLMLQQWIDVIGRLKNKNFNFKGNICIDEVHTWEYVARDLKNFFVYFDRKIGEENGKR